MKSLAPLTPELLINCVTEASAFSLLIEQLCQQNYYQKDRKLKLNKHWARHAWITV